MQVIARSSQAACHSFFTVRRVGMVAARRSTALRFTRSPAMTSRSSGMPELRSSVRNGRAGMARNRSERALAFMAGRCESPPEMSTRDGQPGARPARFNGFGPLRAKALLFSVRTRGDNGGDRNPQGLVAINTVVRKIRTIVRNNAAKGQRALRRPGPIHEGSGGARIARRPMLQAAFGA